MNQISYVTIASIALVLLALATSLSQAQSIDPAFYPTIVDNVGVSRVKALAVKSDGKIVVGGDFTAVSGIGRNWIARLNSDGSVDSSFVPVGADNVINNIGIQTDGKIVIVGSFFPNLFDPGRSGGTRWGQMSEV